MRVREDLVPRLVAAVAHEPADGIEIEGFGRIQFAPGAAYAVRVPFEGYIERVLVQRGTRVAAGTLLATARSSEVSRLRTELRRVGASLVAERDGLRRLETLLAEGAASSREVVEARARLAALNAEEQGVHDALSAGHIRFGSNDNYELRASRPGDVLSRTVEPGERVAPSDAEAAFTVGDPRSLLLRVDFPERDATLLGEGARCRFRVPAVGNVEFTGHVISIARALDRTNRTASVSCAPDKIDPHLQAEMAAEAYVSISAAGTLVVPRAAVLLRHDKRVVLVRRSQNELERREVAVGVSLGNEVQITSGLGRGEQVIVEGAVLLEGELEPIF